MRPGLTFVKILSTGSSSVPSESAVISKFPTRIRYQPGVPSLEVGICPRALDTAKTPTIAVKHGLIDDKNLRIEYPGLLKCMWLVAPIVWHQRPAEAAARSGSARWKRWPSPSTSAVIGRRRVARSTARRRFDVLQAPEPQSRPVAVDRHLAHGIETCAADRVPASVAVELALVPFRSSLRVCEPEQGVTLRLVCEDLRQRIDFGLPGRESQRKVNGFRFLRIPNHDDALECGQLPFEGRRRVDDENLAQLLQVQFIEDGRHARSLLLRRPTYQANRLAATGMDQAERMSPEGPVNGTGATVCGLTRRQEPMRHFPAMDEKTSWPTTTRAPTRRSPPTRLRTRIW